MALGPLTLDVNYGTVGRSFSANILGLTTGNVEVLSDGTPGFSTVNGRVNFAGGLPNTVNTLVLREYQPGVGQGYRDSRIEIIASGQNYPIAAEAATGSPLAAQVRAAMRNIDRNLVATLKPFGLLVGAATGGGNTRLMVFASKQPFLAIEVGYEHVGGFGAATGIAAIVAATDDPGPLDYSLGNTATLKKMITPKRGGTEYNSLDPNGWQAVTWGGAATTTASDAGALNTQIAWSDIIPCRSVQAADGLYYGIVRFQEAAGPYSYGTYPGMTSGTQYNDDARFAKIAYTLKSGDNVTVPSNWTTANTITITDSPGPNIIVRLHALSAERPKVVMTVGDSRFGAVNEAPFVSTRGYDNFSFKLAQYLIDNGVPVHLVDCAQGGLASVSYQQRALKLMATVSPDIAPYLVYSINDGNPTAALVDAAKLRAQQFVRRCVQLGTMPFLVSSYPRGGMTAPENALLRALDVWTASLGLPWFSPIAVYGNVDGTWRTGVSSDNTNHMNQASYQDMAVRVGQLLVGLNF
jgi:hypothetical protein